MRSIALLYFASHLISLLGTAIAGVLLPLIVLAITGSPISMAIVAAASAIPAVVGGLVFGVVIDRVDRRKASIVADVISGISIAALPVVALVTELSLGWFVLFGVIGAVGDVPGMTAREALLPAVARHSGTSLDRLIGLRESLGAVGLLVGPALAGLLFSLLDSTAVLWVTAATSLVAAALTWALPRSVGQLDPREAAVTTSSWSQLRDGWSLLARDRFLVVVTGLTLASVLIVSAFQGVILPVFFVAEGRPEMLGYVLTALAAGLLVGSGLYAVVAPRLSRRVWLLLGLGGLTAGFAVIATLSTIGVVFVGAFVVGLFSGLCGSLLGVLMLEGVPEAMRGRVLGTQNSLIMVASPLAIALAAVLIQLAELRVAAAIFVVVLAVSSAAAALDRSLRALDRPQAEPARA